MLVTLHKFCLVNLMVGTRVCYRAHGKKSLSMVRSLRGREML